MQPWDQRPIEVANLLNPAFCGEILRQCIRSYQHTMKQPFPYPLVFLVLPIILHRRTRELLSPRQKLPLHVWLQSHSEVKIGFRERTAELIPITTEAIIFLLQVEALRLDDQAHLEVLPYKKTIIEGQSESEIADYYRKAIMVGRWFARSGTATTIYAMWGVKP